LEPSKRRGQHEKNKEAISCCEPKPYQLVRTQTASDTPPIAGRTIEALINHTAVAKGSPHFAALLPVAHWNSPHLQGTAEKRVALHHADLPKPVPASAASVVI
jgi:hypothetical protein